MREALKVNREETISLHSLFGLDIAFCLGFCWGYGSCIALLFNTISSPVRLFDWFTVGIVVCLGL